MRPWIKAIKYLTLQKLSPFKSQEVQKLESQKRFAINFQVFNIL